MQFAVNFNVNTKNVCEEVLITDSFDLDDTSPFTYLDELTQVENEMIDAEMADDLKLHILSILFSFNSNANELKRASAVVSSIFHLIFNIVENIHREKIITDFK